MGTKTQETQSVLERLCIHAVILITVQISTINDKDKRFPLLRAMSRERSKLAIDLVERTEEKRHGSWYLEEMHETYINGRKKPRRFPVY